MATLTASVDLDAELTALLTGPPATFVDRRKALAAALRKAGRKEDAARVAALSKPTPAAWAVDVLHRDHRGEVEALLALGARLRMALRASFGGGGDPRSTSALQAEQRAAALALTRRAREALAAAGLPASDAVLSRVTATLSAIATIGGWGDAAPGQLLRELEPPDVASLATLLLSEGSTESGRPSVVAAAAPARDAVAASAATPSQVAAEVSTPGAPPPALRLVRGPADPAPSPTPRGGRAAGAPGADTARSAALARAEAALARATEREDAARATAERALAEVTRVAAERDAARASVAVAEEEAAAARRAHERAALDVSSAERALAEAELALRRAKEAASAARDALRAQDAHLAAAKGKLLAVEARVAPLADRASRAAADVDEQRAGREAAARAVEAARTRG